MTQPAKPSTQLTPQQHAAVNMKNFFNQGAIKKKFEELVGDRSVSVITSLLQVVSSDKYLVNVDPRSIYHVAVTAAVLNLPINNNLGYAWIVPYQGKAQFQIGWRGFVQLALRSKQYAKINVVEIYENQFKSYDPISETLDADFSKEGEGAIAGYCAYFKLNDGFEKKVYWSTKKVEEHAKKYSKAYSSDKGFTPWKDPVQFPEMAKKTVLKNTLSKWGLLSIEMEKATITDQAVINDAETLDIQHVDHPEAVEQVETSTGKMNIVSEGGGATAATEAKIDSKNNVSESEEDDSESFLDKKVVTIHMTYFEHTRQEVAAGFVGTCTEDNEMTVTINDGQIVCPRSSVKLAPAGATLTVVEEEKEPVAEALPTIRTDYTQVQLESMGSNATIKNIAAQYCAFEKLDDKQITNKKLRNIILHAQEGKLAWFIKKYYSEEALACIRPTYVETYVEPVTGDDSIVEPKLVELQGEERGITDMVHVLNYIKEQTQNKLTDDNLSGVLDKLGEGFYDRYGSLEHICQTAPEEDIRKIIKKFNGK